LLRPSETLQAIQQERQRREYIAAQASLFDYVRASWPVIEPATPYYSNWHIGLICEYLEACYLRQIKRLIINIPPRNMKSILTTVNFPTWCWTKTPALRFLTASYSQPLSTKHSKDRRDIIVSNWYQQGWGNVFTLADDQNLKMEYENDHKGVMIATSVGGSSTGKGGDILIVDDPHNPRGADSDTVRQTALDWYDQTWSTRLNDKKRGVMIVVMQRLHENDLTGHLLENSGEYTHLKVPAVAPEKVVYSFPISGKKEERAEGQLMWPDREGPEEIAGARKRLGSYGFEGQYQQEPNPPEGGLVKREWWRRYRRMPQRFDYLLQSWDLTFKDLESSDFVCGQVWGVYEADAYLLDLINEKLDFVATINAIADMSNKWPNSGAKYVEDKANGPAVISSLRNRVPGLIAVNPEGGKIVRATAVSPFIEAGNVYLPEDADWVQDYLTQWIKFPHGKHDDMVDATTQALNQIFLTSAGEVLVG